MATELWTEHYKAVCPDCGVRYSDWFRDEDGNRWCFLCADGDWENRFRRGLPPTPAQVLAKARRLWYNATQWVLRLRAALSAEPGGRT